MLQKLFFILIVFILQAICDDDTGWSFVGNPLLAAMPCNDSTDILVSFEPGLPPEDENTYLVHINKNFPKYSKIILKFDADTSITLTDKAFARVVLIPIQNSFEIHFFRSHDGISFNVKGLVPGTVPYFKSVTINNKEYCNKPVVGYLDSYLQGYTVHAETPKKTPATNCGRRKVAHTGLIVNGEPTKAGDWPWHAALYRLERATIKYICGGTLLSKNYVLTAAHCASVRGVKVLPEILSVILGKFNLIGGDVGTQEREIHKIIIHDKFSNRYLDNDIALLKLKTEAVFTDYVQPACLWYNNAYEKLPTNKVFGTIVGWGFNQHDTLSPQLTQTSMPVVSESTCLKSNPIFYSSVLNENKFCAGYRNGTSACNGDSGSAFQVFVPDTEKDTSTKDGAWFVRGIVSLSVSRTDAPVCDPNEYVVFTDVEKYIHWINKNM